VQEETSKAADATQPASPDTVRVRAARAVRAALGHYSTRVDIAEATTLRITAEVRTFAAPTRVAVRDLVSSALASYDVSAVSVRVAIRGTERCSERRYVVRVRLAFGEEEGARRSWPGLAELKTRRCVEDGAGECDECGRGGEDLPALFAVLEPGGVEEEPATGWRYCRDCAALYSRRRAV